METFVALYNILSQSQEAQASGRSISIVTGLRAGQSGFDSQLGLEIFLFAAASLPALGLTQLPIQWVA
jgi:hypothetical protein